MSLTDVALRRRIEPERGLYIAESEKVIRRALAAGHRPRSFLMTDRWVGDLADLIERAESDGVPVYVAPHEVIEARTGFHLHRGALASMGRPELPRVTDIVSHATRIVVIEDAACAAGSTYRGRPVGAGADIAAWWPALVRNRTTRICCQSR